METNRLRQFCAVYETQNLRKAAELLGVSHSALSKSLKILQLELNQKLLTQSGRNIAITDAGKSLYPRALELLSAETNLKRPRAPTRKSVLIGAFEAFSTHCLGSAWGKYFEGQDLELHELLPGALERAIASQKIDYGLTYEPIPVSNVEFTRIGFAEMGIYKRKGSFKNLPFESLPFAAPIHPIDGTPSGAKGLDGWPENRHPRNIRFRVDMMESALSLARAGVAAIFAPHFLIRHHNRTAREEHSLIPVAHPSFSPVKRPIYLLRRASAPENDTYRRLAKLIRKECF